MTEKHIFISTTCPYLTCEVISTTAMPSNCTTVSDAIPDISINRNISNRKMHTCHCVSRLNEGK
ncbi:hypothetical protein AAFF_G00308000 [Aldrovandia affinis]|uniref:Uncharacterized protein n=1 Tax=Aldrovandia affinis TaxID=143900 RepID=A0AAD7R8B7_9TELE|nr:hypothetical protein AAFF_G00308000 [Aldrovandia affinis]